jgi:hypothetical protein
MSSADCNCPYPALECPCCCKQKQILQGLINRVSGYECYLKSIIVPASCQGMVLSTTYSNIIQGENPNYRLRFIYSSTFTGGLPGSDIIPTDKINLWPAIGCQCSFTPNPVTLFKSQKDCWGTLPVPGANAMVSFPIYLTNTYGAATAASVNSLIAGATSGTSSLGALKGAVDWTSEVRRIYGSILMSLPC